MLRLLFILSVSLVTGCRFFGTGGDLIPLVEISNGDLYQFGSITLGNSIDAALTLTNNGDSRADSLSASLSSAHFQFKGGAFPGTGGTCGSSLEVRESCTVVIQFNPQEVSASIEGTLDISYAPEDLGTVERSTRRLAGTSLSRAQLSVSDSPTYDFGRVVVDQSADKTFTITNSGQTAATAISPGLSSPYSLPGGGTCTTTLAAAASCSLVVRYTPTNFSTHTDSLSISYTNGFASVSASGSLTGNGVGVSGTIDTTFGTNGFKTVALGLSREVVADAAQDSLNRYYAVSTSTNGSTLRNLLVRWRSNGNLDTTFNTTGIVYVTFTGTGVAIDSTGYVYVAGSGTNGGQGAVAITRYTTDGLLDTPFGTSGIGYAATATGNGGFQPLLFAQTDGKIVYVATCDGTGGKSYGRFKTDGTTDGGFAGVDCGGCPWGGLCSWGGLTGGSWGGHQKIVLALNDPGNRSGNPPSGTLSRLNSNGSLDTSFNTDGELGAPASSVQGEATITGVALDSSGNSYIAVDQVEGTNNMAIAKYNGSGTLQWLGTDGQANNSIRSGVLEVLPDQSVLVAALSDSVSTAANKFIYFLNDGTLDVTFGTVGVYQPSVHRLTKRLFPQSNSRSYAIGGFDALRITKLRDPTAPIRERSDSSSYLDTQFQTGGILVQKISTDTNAMVASFSLDSTGKLYVLGEAYLGLSGNYSPVIVRYKTDGVLDTSFHTDGIADSTISGASTLGTTGIRLFLRTDGRPLVVHRSGVAQFGTTGLISSFSTGAVTVFDAAFGTNNSVVAVNETANKIFIQRIASNNVLDSTFTTAVGAGAAGGYGIVLQTSGAALVVGYATSASNVQGFSITRFNNAGIIDTAFATGGTHIATFAPSTDKAIRITFSTQNILSIGNAAGGFGIARYLSDGAVDTTFNQVGKVRHSIAGLTLTAYDSGLTTDGGAYVIGKSSTSTWVTLRIRSDGTLETGFGTGGFFRAGFGTAADVPKAAILQTDGKILVGGYTTDSTTKKAFTIIRLWP